MRATLSTALLLALAATSVARPASAEGNAPSAPFVVIVNSASPVSVVERQFLEDAFLKRVTRWPNDEGIRPVDLPSDSPVRRRFSEVVLKRSVEAIKNYWQQRIFSGRDVPPAELGTDDEVVAYVVAHPGAVGYVSTGTDLKGARPLVVR